MDDACSRRNYTAGEPLDFCPMRFSQERKDKNSSPIGSSLVEDLCLLAIGSDSGAAPSHFISQGARLRHVWPLLVLLDAVALVSRH